MKVNFEYVEVFISAIRSDEQTNKRLKWCSLTSLIKELIEQYQKFSNIYQLALPILLNYFYNKGEVHVDI